MASNPLLTTLVSLVPPLPYMPPDLRGVFAAAILIVRGAADRPSTWRWRPPTRTPAKPAPLNTVSQPSSNAEFLANQLQSNGHFELEDGQALVLTIDPGDAELLHRADVRHLDDHRRLLEQADQPEQRTGHRKRRRHLHRRDLADRSACDELDSTPVACTRARSPSGSRISIPTQPNQPRILDQQVIDADELRELLPATTSSPNSSVVSSS